VYATRVLPYVNQLLEEILKGNHSQLLATLADAPSVAAAVSAVDLDDVLPADQQDAVRALLEAIPPAIDAAVLAAIRSAVARGVSVQMSWQPGYYFDVRIHDVSSGSTGMVTIALTSRDPDLETNAWGTPFS
jgi:hypothetical protein